MASIEKCLIPEIGTLLRLKGGSKNFEFHGKDVSGKILLKDPQTCICYLVYPEEVNWTPIVHLKAS